MSILLPWDRRGHDKDEAAERPPKRDGRRVAGRDPLRRDQISPQRRTVAVLAAAGAAAAFALLLRVPFPSHLPAVWESPGSQLVSVAGARYLLRRGSEFSVWDASGKVLDVGALPGEPALGESRILTVDRDRLIGVDFAGEMTAIAGARQGESILACLPGGLVLTASPSDGLRFGESWRLRALRETGALVWQQQLQGPPALVALASGRILAGLSDVSAGGVPLLVCLEAGDGEIAWTRALQQGLWRAVGARSDGGAVAVLDTCVTSVDATGAALWTITPDGPVMAAAVARDTVFLAIARGPGQGLGAILSPYVVEAVSSGGKVTWTAGLRERPWSIGQWQEALPDGQSSTCLVALGQSHVIGFSMRDGERLFGMDAGSRPVSLQGGCLLVQKSHGLCLVGFRPGGMAGRAQSP